MFSQLLKPFLTKTYPCTMDEVRHSIQKEKRIIDTLEPVMMQHKLIIDPQVIRKDLDECESDMTYSCFHQMSRLTGDRGALRHDDRLDCLAMAVAYWVEQIDTDATRAEADRMEEEMDKFMTKYVEGYESNSGDTWLDSFI
jgi:hypothetical protein